MGRKPVILICWGACVEPHFLTQGMMMTKNYGWVVSANGGIPIVPLDANSIDTYCEMADGLLLPGGMYYTGVRKKNMLHAIEGHARKEAFESELYDRFKKTGKPIFGICDGEQKINCCQGGRLALVTPRYHTTHYLTAHEITNEPDSFVAEAWGHTATINSYHELSVEVLGKDLKVVAKSPEGVVEAIEHKSLPIYGVQFHPERMRGDNVFPAEGNNGDDLLRPFIRRCAEIKKVVGTS